jgi:hypothetical protein
LKFSGQIKFPEIDHPGVPIGIVIEGSKIELVVEGESLGRWSLYDVHARRLVASAFQIELDGTEVTFVADDPIDFAYRGVEHMAETWASIKSKRLAARSLAVRKSRKDIIPSRIEEMKEAMVANLEGRSEPRQLAGEVSMPEAPAADLAGESAVEERAPAEAISEETVSEELQWVEEERQRLAAERAQFEEERRLAEEREANRVEAYRIEMARLKAERDELQRRAEELAKEAVADEEVPAEPEPVAAGVPESESEPEPLPEPVAEESEPDEEPEPVLEEPEPVAEVPEPEPERVLEEPETEPDEEPEPAVVGAPPVVDLNDLEHETESLPDPDKEPAAAARQPAMAGAARQRGGLMGAVRAAFRSSSREHEHQFVEAPGGIGITRYVCEECGYVSISA